MSELFDEKGGSDNDRYFSRANFEMLFWVSLILTFISLFSRSIEDSTIIFYIMATVIFWIGMKLFR